MLCSNLTLQLEKSHTLLIKQNFINRILNLKYFEIRFKTELLQFIDSWAINVIKRLVS